MYRLPFRIALAWAALFVSTHASAQATIGGEWRTDVHDYARQLIDAGLAPGLSVAVVAGDRVIESFGTGLADVETGSPVDGGTRFYIASSTKALTATAVVQLAAEGRIDLQAPVTRYLPDLRFGDGVDADAITIHDLLTMTDGIADRPPVVFRTAYTGEFTVEQLIEQMAELPASEDGRSFDYSNFPYNVLGLVLDAVDDGRTEPGGWKRVVRSEVLDPLDMREVTALRSSLEDDRIAKPHVVDGSGRFVRSRLAKDDANLHAAGGHFASARSLARFVAAHISGGKLEGRRVFEADVIASTHRRHVAQDRRNFGYHRDGWGYGWDLAAWGDARIVQRFGGFTGYFAHMSFLPEHDLGVVVLSNGRSRTPAAELMAGYIYERLLGRDDVESRYSDALNTAQADLKEHGRDVAEALAGRAERLAPLPQPLGAYTGTFRNDALGTMHWQVVAGGLEVTMGVAHARAEVFDADRNLLRVTLTGGGTVCGFEFDESGNALRVRWNEYDFLPVEVGAD